MKRVSSSKIKKTVRLDLFRRQDRLRQTVQLDLFRRQDHLHQTVR